MSKAANYSCLETRNQTHKRSETQCTWNAKCVAKIYLKYVCRRGRLQILIIIIFFLSFFDVHRKQPGAEAKATIISILVFIDRSLKTISCQVTFKQLARHTNLSLYVCRLLNSRWHCTCIVVYSVKQCRFECV